MITQAITPYIRVAMDSLIDAPWELKERVIFDYELLYVKEGEIIVTIEDSEYAGLPGDIFLFKPRSRHSIKTVGTKRFRQPHLHFDLFYQPDSPDVRISFRPLEHISEQETKWFREAVDRGSDLWLPDKISLQNTLVFEKMLFGIIDEFGRKLPYYELHIKGLFINLWTYLMREQHWSSIRDVFSNTDILFDIKDYLDNHPAKEISLDELAGQFKISKYHLARLFKKAFSMTPIHYHRLVRIHKAKELIQFSGMSITEISELCGFKGIHTFSRMFREVEGVPPSFYRHREYVNNRIRNP